MAHTTHTAEPGRWLPGGVRIRVFVIDDHPLACAGLAAMLADSSTLQWVGDAHSLAEALRAAPVAAPDVVLIDDDLPGVSGLQGMQRLQPYLPHCRFVVLAREPDAALQRSARDAGAACVLMKSATAHDLRSVVQAAYLGRAWTPAAAAAVTPVPPQLGADLTHRERDLLALLVRGMTNHDISTQLGIAVPTVKFHVSNVMSKLGVDNRTAAVLVALRLKLVAAD